MSSESRFFPLFFADIFAGFAEEAVEDCTRKHEYKENHYQTRGHYTRGILLILNLGDFSILLR